MSLHEMGPHLKLPVTPTALRKAEVVFKAILAFLSAIGLTIQKAEMIYHYLSLLYLTLDNFNLGPIHVVTSNWKVKPNPNTILVSCVQVRQLVHGDCMISYC